MAENEAVVKARKAEDKARRAYHKAIRDYTRAYDVAKQKEAIADTAGQAWTDAVRAHKAAQAYFS